MSNPLKNKAASAIRAEPIRPMRNILQCLPMLPMTKTQKIDFQAADPAMLVVLAEDAPSLSYGTR